MKTGALQRDPPLHAAGTAATPVWNVAPESDQTRALDGAFAALDHQIVRGVAERFVPAAGSLLDLSSDAHLRDRLTVDMSQRCTPAAVRVCDLAAGTGSHAALLGLNTFDHLDDPERARDEIARVLAPGGAFIHFLDDVNAWITPLFKTLVRHGNIPFPNFLADPGLLEQLDDAQRAKLPVTAGRDDLLIASWQEFGAVLQILFELGHSISNRLIPYARLFKPATFNAPEAAAEFAKLSADPRRRGQLNKMLLTVYLAVNDESNRELAPLELKPLASLDFFAARLRNWFDAEHGFEVEFCDLVSARQQLPGSGLPAPERYQLRSVGRRLALADVPAQLAGCNLLAQPDGNGSSAIESALHVFVARKN